MENKKSEFLNIYHKIGTNDFSALQILDLQLKVSRCAELCKHSQLNLIQREHKQAFAILAFSLIAPL